jgi:hypothetical protein
MMGSGFLPASRGRVLGLFSPAEADLLRSLVSQVVELVRDESPEPQAGDDPLESLLDLGGPLSRPEDPVLARLLPDAYSEDAEAAGEFRRYTERGLRDQKAEQGRRVIADLEEAGLGAEVDAEDVPIEVELTAGQCEAWLRCLTDVRLALGTRLGVEEGDEDYWDSLPDDDPRAYMHDVYDWLAYVQESLLQALS